MSARSIRRAHERKLEHDDKRERLGGRGKLAAGAGAALGATVVFAPAADAATFTVTNLNDSGAGSLRDAIEDANANGQDDVVVFQSALTGTINLTSGGIEISGEALDLQGPGASSLTVDGGGNSGIFYAHSFTDPGEDVRISGLTLTNGDLTDPTANFHLGAALYSDTGLVYAPDLTVADSVLTGNRVGDDDRGGAIWQDGGTLTVSNSVLSNNVAGQGGGAIYHDDTSGAGDVDLLIRNSTLSGNTAGLGSGTFGGGGLSTDGADGGILIEGSTFAANTAAYGGALHIGSVDGDILIQNSTVSGNRSDYDGGGIYFGLLDDAHTAAIRNATIVENTASIDPGSGLFGGGGVYSYDGSDDPDDSGPVDLSSTIVANNTADFGPDLGQGEFADGFVAGFSLIENPADAVIAEARSARANVVGVDPELGPLADNGGPTQTHLPGTRSPVVDAGIANGLTTDQRGLARTADLDSESNAAGSDATDIGSVEIQVADCQGRSAVRQDGTDGDDRLDGTDGSDAISGLAGDDVIKGLGFRDCLFGDDDKDTVKGGGGRDEARGGAGKDKVNGQAGKDKLKGDGGRDNVNGGGGKDRVTGGKGKDRVRGGPGKDRLKGGKGKDKLLAKGGKKDRVNCGAGDGDKAIVSENDKVSRNCEKVVVRGG